MNGPFIDYGFFFSSKMRICFGVVILHFIVSFNILVIIIYVLFGRDLNEQKNNIVGKYEISIDCCRFFLLNSRFSALIQYFSK